MIKNINNFRRQKYNKTALLSRVLRNFFILENQLVVILI